MEAEFVLPYGNEAQAGGSRGRKSEPEGGGRRANQGQGVDLCRRLAGHLRSGRVLSELLFVTRKFMLFI